MRSLARLYAKIHPRSQDCPSLGPDGQTCTRKIFHRDNEEHYRVIDDAREWWSKDPLWGTPNFTCFKCERTIFLRQEVKEKFCPYCFVYQEEK